MSAEPVVKKQMVSARDAAAMLGVDSDTVLYWAKLGKLPVFRLSKRIIRFKVADIDALIERSAA